MLTWFNSSAEQAQSSSSKAIGSVFMNILSASSVLCRVYELIPYFRLVKKSKKCCVMIDQSTQGETVFSTGRKYRNTHHTHVQLDELELSFPHGYDNTRIM